jgi:hypothetical protein
MMAVTKGLLLGMWVASQIPNSPRETFFKIAMQAVVRVYRLLLTLDTKHLQQNFVF